MWRSTPSTRRRTELLRRTSLHLIHTLEHTSTTGHGGTQRALQRDRNENLKVGSADMSEEA
jgi:hypothetical protein